ncbi:hypothetical protein AB0D35_26330 [Streptomyces sp. NPDC048301]|uniref:hypothetical protein n=1 Tax=Streptomyces sp. NPDC048301 TaxID=3155631 RepID=UPI0034387280
MAEIGSQDLAQQLSWSDFQLTLNPQAMRIGPTPADIELRVRCHDIKYQRGLPHRPLDAPRGPP